MAEPMPAHRRASAEDGPGPRRERAAGPLVLRPQREHRLPEQPDEPAHVGPRPGDDPAPAGPVEPLPRRVRGHRIAGKRGRPPRVDGDPDAPRRGRLGERAEAHVQPLGPRRHPHRTDEPTLDLGPCRQPAVRLAVVLVHPARRRDPAPQGVQRAGLEPLLEGQAGLPRAAPGQRHRQAAPRAERVDEAEPRAVGESVLLDAFEDGQEHGAPGQSAECAAHDAAPRIGRPRALADQQDQRHRLAPHQRRVALADLDRLEPPARPQSGRDPVDGVGFQRVPDGDAGQKQDIRVGDRMVPVHPQLGDDLRRGNGRQRGGLNRRRKGRWKRRRRSRPSQWRGGRGRPGRRGRLRRGRGRRRGRPGPRREDRGRPKRRGKRRGRRGRPGRRGSLPWRRGQQHGEQRAGERAARVPSTRAGPALAAPAAGGHRPSPGALPAPTSRPPVSASR